MNICFDKTIQNFIDYCNDQKINLYLVGGAIRDFLLNRNTYDYDFALVSDYKQALSLLSKKYKCKENDKYQAIKIQLGKYNIEISHCRKEKGTIDYRHPLQIEFINDIKEDSNRRDFTINAFYYKNNEIYDFHNGLQDLENKTLIVVGDTLTRFKEDSLRILRMIRFACYGFKIETKDNKIIFANKNLLTNLSLESFNNEFNRILLTKNISIINKYKSIFEYYFKTEFSNLKYISNLDTLSEMKTFLGIENKSLLYKYKDVQISDNKMELNKLIYKYSKNVIKELVVYHDKLNNTDIINNFNEIINNYYYDKKQLNINMNRLIFLIEDKRKVKYYIDLVSYAIIEKKIQNKKEEIEKYIMERKNEIII